MVGGMSGRRHRLQSKAVAGEHLAVRDVDVGPERRIYAGLERFEAPDLVGMKRTCGPVWPFGYRRGPGCRLDGDGGGRMVAMRMGDEDVRHRLAAHRIKQRSDVLRVIGAGIDDGHAPTPDDVAHGALEGEGARIVAEQPADAGRNLLDLARRQVEGAIEGYVVDHARQYSAPPQRRHSSRPA